MDRALLTRSLNLTNLATLTRPTLLSTTPLKSSLTHSRRTEATYQRTRARLRVKPDPTFLPSPSEPQDHIIYNPPPSAPSIHQTPSIFLPPNDPRRQLLTQQSTDPAATAASPQKQFSAPPMRPLPPPKKYHLKEADLEEMRRLRKEDPLQWSAAKLAKKFECSGLFVSLATADVVSNERRKQQKQVLEAVKSRWGAKRRRAREDRALRKETWGRFD
ncbi:MAG: hypothetical protein Q9160_001483 [Pyrenula sp. 1 TL-2023]